MGTPSGCELRFDRLEPYREGLWRMKALSPVVKASLFASVLLSIVAFSLSITLSLNHFPQTESSAVLSAGGVFLSFIFLSPALEWYLPPRTVGRSKLGVAALFSTGLIIVAVGYWVSLAISSFSTPVSLDPSFYNGMYLSMIGGLSLFVTSMMKAVKEARRA